jgi:hypothetical protein
MRPLFPILVAAAALAVSPSPLSAQTTVSSTGFEPDAAYNATIDRYLVTWCQTGTLYPTVRTRLLTSAGSTTGSTGTIPVGGFFQEATAPSVAPVQTGLAMFVVVTIGGTGFARYTLASAVGATGAVLATREVAGFLDDHTSADVGGEVTAADDDVLIVFHNATQQKIELAEFNAATMTTLQRIDLASGPGLGRPSISKTGGQPDRYLVVWEQTTGGNTDLYGAVVGRDLQVLASAFPIAQTAADEDDPDVDGDGTDWQVVYERESSENSGDNDILCRNVTFDPRSSSVYQGAAAVVIEGSSAVEERDPAVVRSGESCAVGYSRHFGGIDFDLFVESREVFQCLLCEGEFPWATTANTLEGEIALASGPLDDGGLIVWRAATATSSRILASVFVADDGTVRLLGGGCGPGGTNAITCAKVGVPSFGLRVQHAAPQSAGWLVLGLVGVAFNCGPCALVPNPTVVAPVTTDSNGNSQLTFALPANPSLRGTKLLSQWLTVAAGGCSTFGLAFSDAIEITIE